MKTLTTDEAAARAGVSRQAISQALNAGRLKGKLVKIKQEWRITEAALERWMAERS